MKRFLVFYAALAYLFLYAPLVFIRLPELSSC
jgi:hypothetical protein